MPKTKKTTKSKKAAKKETEEPKKLEVKEKKVKKAKAVIKEEIREPFFVKPEKYLESVGRRKTAVARIRLFTRRGIQTSIEGEVSGAEEKLFLINEKLIDDYFSIPEFRRIAQAALEKMNCLDKFRVLAVVKGGGLRAQAEAIRHGVSRGLVLFNPDFKKRLKKAGFLTRDPRMRERKKFGLKRARRAPQWSKR